MAYTDFKDLLAYQRGFNLAMDIYELSKSFPREETYSLTDQIRRSSRSVCACLGEAYRKRLYEAHFISKVSDADMENGETQVWLDFARACKYLDQSTHDLFLTQSREVGKLLSFMMNNPDKFRY